MVYLNRNVYTEFVVTLCEAGYDGGNILFNYRNLSTGMTYSESLSQICGNNRYNQFGFTASNPTGQYQYMIYNQSDDKLLETGRLYINGTHSIYD